MARYSTGSKVPNSPASILENAGTWKKISSAAAAARFLWSDVAEEIVEKLYLTAG